MALSEQPGAKVGSRGTWLASLAALGSIIVASSCCWPVLPFLFAAGAAGGSAVLWRLRPYLLGASVAFLGLGFYQSWRVKQCHAKPRVLNTVLLWFAAAVVVVSIFFPEVFANLLAG